MVVAQLVERLLPTPEIGGSNPIIDINDQYSTICGLENLDNKGKRGQSGMAHLLKNSTLIQHSTTNQQPPLSFTAKLDQHQFRINETIRLNFIQTNLNLHPTFHPR